MGDYKLYKDLIAPDEDDKGEIERLKAEIELLTNKLSIANAEIQSLKSKISKAQEVLK